MRWVRWVLVVAFSLLVAASPAPAQRQEAPAPDAGPPSGSVLGLLPGDAVTEHSLDAGGRALAYVATAGTFSLYDQSGQRSAAIFYTAYTLKGAAAGTRPVTFVFNGGPGAASAYLHLGLVGPRSVSFGPDGGGARLGDNPDTWLAFTDLVLIDPVGTGWSRAAKPDKAGDFWSVRADAQSIAKVIALYVARNSRTDSPKYLLGESYGGFRALKVARALQQDQGIPVDGIVMVSPLLEGALVLDASRLPLGAALQLPSLAAAELDRRHRFTPEALAAAERFALTDYLTTLAGRPPEGEAARAFYARVAEITGLPLDAIARARGFAGDAAAKLGDSRIASPYDPASPAPDPFPESASDEGPDPVLDGRMQALGGLFVGYARDALGFRTDMTFTLLNREAARKWDWEGRGGPGQASAERDLRELLALDPRLRVLVAHGRSDLVTPYAANRYVLDHLPPIGPPGRTALKLYPGGHMFYVDPASRAGFTADAAAFYRDAGQAAER